MDKQEQTPTDELTAGCRVPRVAAAAVALRAVLAQQVPGVPSPAERHLLGEWLDRLADADG